MRRLALLALPLAVASAMATATAPARAQNYTTALQLTPDERRALESRLSTILDYAQDNQVARFELPGGGQAAIRPYRAVRGSNGRLCRGYRVDVDSLAGRSAVDGYRCREGQAWVIAEPETTLQQAGPLDLRTPGAPPASEVTPPPGSFADRMRERLGNPNAPYDGEPEPEPENASLFGPGEVPPLPRKAPARVATAAPPADAAGRPAPTAPATTDSAAPPGNADIATAAPQITARPAEPQDTTAGAGDTGGAATTSDAGDTGDAGGGPGETSLVRQNSVSSADADTPPNDTFAPTVRARLTTDRAEPAAAPSASAPAAPPRDVTPRGDGPTGTGPVDVAATDTTRVVGAPVAGPPGGDATDERVVAALKELDYLPASTDGSSSAVQDAIGDFARDERFALPVPATTLLARLNDALDRSGSLPVCTTDTQTMCIAP
ncbi:hypothetical protein [Acuticoccus sp. I52.16.1]|uniref:hypothetical protein n=1 Tax=Acuticoccus sp. I52.16.1 TaxID=2928472 RepID=UPI001FD03691|nr:hypothetical protein [Acuticoccus sp. I52.16.1]UOM35173.1 hypothetical protein MRB58_02885 [Acuticoccus sp. I52.16.1]